jgi:hypothetical protein
LRSNLKVEIFLAARGPKKKGRKASKQSRTSLNVQARAAREASVCETAEQQAESSAGGRARPSHPPTAAEGTKSNKRTITRGGGLKENE